MFQTLLAEHDGPDDAFADELYAAYLQHRFEATPLYADTAALFSSLDPTLRLALLSNGNTHPQHLGIADRFDVILGETQEDHRWFADAVVAMLQACRWPASDASARPSMQQLVDPVLLVYFPDLRRERAEKAERFLQSLGSR
mgnify:CR=1 FL=1